MHETRLDQRPPASTRGRRPQRGETAGSFNHVISAFVFQAGDRSGTATHRFAESGSKSVLQSVRARVCTPSRNSSVAPPILTVTPPTGLFAH
jgi:hypothetical protein